MEKNEAIREWCVERSLDLLRLGLGGQPDAKVNAAKVVDAAKAIEEYITNPASLRG